MAEHLPWILPLVSLAFLAHACWALAADAREGYDVGMGAAGQFSLEWLLGAAAGAWALALAFSLAWYWGVLVFVVLFLAKSVVYRVVVGMNLGKAAPPLPKDGFREFSRRAAELDASAEKKD